MDLIEIPAGRLHLRPWQSYDAPAVLAACQDPEISRWTTVPSPYTQTDAEQWCGPVTDAGWDSGTAATFAVLDSTTGGLLGSVGLGSITEREAEVGWWATYDARGAGVTTQAVAAVCRWGFAGLGLDRIAWRAEVGNWPSRAVAEKCGFTVEGRRRRELPHRGGFVDAWTGSLLATDEVVDRRVLPARLGLTDGVVGLRRWRSTDAADVQRACDDPLTARWLPVPSPYSLTDAVSYVEALTPGLWSDGSSAELAVTDAVTGELLGAAGLKLGGRQALGFGEIGYWTAPWARGRGVAGWASVLLARWGLEGLGLSRVELYADVQNLASQRAAQKAGFVREGIARQSRRDRDGTAQDMVLFSCLREDLPTAVQAGPEGFRTGRFT